MKIERTVAKFEPIIITLETQEDVNAMFNVAILAGEHEEAESTGAYDYASHIAEHLQPHIETEEEVVEEKKEFVEVDEIPTGN